MADPNAPRGLTPKKARADTLRALTRKNTWLEDLGVGAILLGPVVVGMGVPMTTHYLAHGGDRDIPAALGASILLTLGGYAAFFAFLLGAFDRERPSLFARVPTLDPTRPQPSGSLVLVEGRVRAIDGASVRGPLTGREGVWSIARIAVQFPAGRRQHRGPGMDTLDDAIPFEIVEARGRAVRVEPAGGWFERGRTIDDDGSAYPEGVAACLARSDVSVGPGEHVRVSEVVLRAGEAITVIGVLRHGEGYRGGAAESLVLVGDDQDELQVRLGSRAEALSASKPTPSRLPAVFAVLMLGTGLALTVWIAL